MIELQPYTSKWKSNFNQLKNLLSSTPDNIFIAIAHIGSTAIETAPAKDIVDIQCAISSFDQLPQVSAILEPLGFIYNNDFKQDHVPFHTHDYFTAAWEKRFFSGKYLNQAFNIHIRLVNSLNWIFAEQFRDFMNNNDNARYAYMQFKQRLAASGIDKHNYCIIKDSVIDLLTPQFFKPEQFKLIIQ